MSIIDSIYSALDDFWLSFLLLVQKLITTCWDIVTDFFNWCFSEVLDLVTTVLGAINLQFITDAVPVFSDIPPEVLNIMGLIGFGQCMVIISGAILVRIGLQLIPFVRLGS